MRQVIEIKPEWLIEIAPHYYKEKDIEVSEAGERLAHVFRRFFFFSFSASRNSRVCLVPFAQDTAAKKMPKVAGKAVEPTTENTTFGRDVVHQKRMS
eukprot:SAG11_NODE_1033_length_6095_cov_5.337725_10_plen_97_part_00